MILQKTIQYVPYYEIVDFMGWANEERLKLRKSIRVAEQL